MGYSLSSASGETCAYRRIEVAPAQAGVRDLIDHMWPRLRGADFGWLMRRSPSRGGLLGVRTTATCPTRWETPIRADPRSSRGMGGGASGDEFSRSALPARDCWDSRTWQHVLPSGAGEPARSKRTGDRFGRARETFMSCPRARVGWATTPTSAGPTRPGPQRQAGPGVKNAIASVSQQDSRNVRGNVGREVVSERQSNCLAEKRHELPTLLEPFDAVSHEIRPGHIFEVKLVGEDEVLALDVFDHRIVS